MGQTASCRLHWLRAWYRRLQSNIQDMPGLVRHTDGSIQAATLSTSVEILMTHKTGGLYHYPHFLATFLLTYKSFTTLDQLFNILVQRFYFRAPDGLTTVEFEKWKTLQQHVVRSRVLEILEALLADNSVTEKDDFRTFDRIKDFLQQEAVNEFPASKRRILALIDGTRKLDSSTKMTPSLVALPESGTDKQSFLETDPLEFAQQLTILQSRLYQLILPAEIIERSQDERTEHEDNITRIIDHNSSLANWVADEILHESDSETRAKTIKQFILVADKCRSLQDHASMAAIVSGLNSPPIERLKRTWVHINSRRIEQFRACEAMVDARNNFAAYQETLASMAPPCVPLIDASLAKLEYIRDHSKDTLPDNLINFRKLREVSKIIQDVRRWQTLPHQFLPLPVLQAHIEESLGNISDQNGVADRLWHISFEREPYETDADKMSRLLQEAGFM